MKSRLYTDDEAGPTVQTGRLEGDFDGEVPDYRVVVVVSNEGNVVVITQRHASPSGWGQPTDTPCTTSQSVPFEKEYCQYIEDIVDSAIMGRHIQMFGV